MSPKSMVETIERPTPPFTTADKAKEEVEEAKWQQWREDPPEVRPLTPDERLKEVFDDGVDSGLRVKRDPQTDGKRVDWPLKSRLKE